MPRSRSPLAVVHDEVSSAPGPSLELGSGLVVHDEVSAPAGPYWVVVHDEVGVLHPFFSAFATRTRHGHLLRSSASESQFRVRVILLVVRVRWASESNDVTPSSQLSRQNTHCVAKSVASIRSNETKIRRCRHPDAEQPSQQGKFRVGA